MALHKLHAPSFFLVVKTIRQDNHKAMAGEKGLERKGGRDGTKGMVFVLKSELFGSQSLGIGYFHSPDDQAHAC